MYCARKVYRQRLQFFRDNVAAIIKIQAFWRAKKTKKDYKQLGGCGLVEHLYIHVIKLEHLYIHVIKLDSEL